VDAIAAKAISGGGGVVPRAASFRFFPPRTYELFQKTGRMALTNYSTLSILSTLTLSQGVIVMSDFGTVLREKRQASGLSQRQLAGKIGVDFSYISKLENGRLPPPAAETVTRLAEVLGCPVEELLAAAKKMPPELHDSIGQPAAVRFLQEASRLRLSQTEWEQLLGTLHGLRSDQSEEGGK
jgi:transcriptional regulator with XRE-family HTH domain